MTMKQIRKAHRAAYQGHHYVSLRTWLRAQKELHPKLTGKARNLVVGQRGA
jgi:hypothetical protein